MKKVRVAQIGLTLIHAPRFRDSLIYLQDEIDIVGFWDPEANSDAVRATMKPDVAHVPVYDSIEELLREAKPDVVMISGYPRDMPAWMLQAAEAGVNVWADKPYAVHSSQLLPVKAAIERNNLIFSCGYTWRFDPTSVLIKETFDAGLLGRGLAVEIRFFGGNLIGRDLSHWQYDPALSGGGMLNSLGCHWFDLMRHWTGSDVTEVTALEANVSREPIEVEDAAFVSLRFANGMIGSLATGNLLPSGSENTFRLMGSQGAVSWSPADQSCTITSTNPAWEAAPKRTFAFPRADLPGYGGHGATVLRALIRALRGEAPSGFTIDDPIKSLQIIEAAHESSKTGEVVRLE
jgi:myo-inositol 2-dehydrogenase/D-chiro-inositol 1-dehydrogenase